MTATASGPVIQAFDPFNDRTARDIRNLLSEAFVTALARLDLSPVRQAVDELGALSAPKACNRYIQDRVRRYGEVIEQAADHVDDPKHRTILVWNAGLFFECHEHLETLWMKATGNERKALQGLIKAAGVFVHRELDRRNAGEKLAPKAAALLESCREQLSFVANLEELIGALKQEGAEAPKLKRQ